MRHKRRVFELNFKWIGINFIEHLRRQKWTYTMLLSAIFFVYENGAGYIFGPVFFLNNLWGA